ncbi:MAG: MATE family efflux transporter [Bacillota bacterium]|jgi:putative MATE family efflux protein
MATGTQAAQLQHPEVPQSEIRQKILGMVWPATIENVLQMLVSIVATGMVGKLGAEAVAAVGLSSRLTHILWAIFSAIGTGATVLIARSVGANNPQAAHRTAKQALFLAVGLVLTLAVAIWANAGSLLRMLFNPDASLLDSSHRFLRLAIWGAPFMAVMQVVGAILRGAGNTKTPMQVAFAVNVVNVILNYVFIYGPLGLPAMGMMGAAWAMVTSQLLGGLLALFVITRPISVVSLSMRQGYRPDVSEMRKILGIGVPAAFEHLFWQGATIVMMGLIVSFGTEALAAHQLGLNAEALSYMPSAGFGIAATAFVGQSLGARRKDLAVRYVKEISLWGILLTIVTGGLLIVIPERILGMLSNDAEVIRLGAIYLRMMGFVQLPSLMSGVWNGALRGAGDTRAPMVIGGIGIWGIRIPLSFVFGKWMGMGVIGVWVAMTVDLVLRFILSWWRYRAGRWQETRLLEDAS